jgi:hypothetical protein
MWGIVLTVFYDIGKGSCKCCCYYFLAFSLQENVACCLQEKPIGNCSGMYEKQQLFQTKKNHGRFIPLMSLVKAEDFFGSPSAGTVLFSKYLCRVR